MSQLVEDMTVVRSLWLDCSNDGKVMEYWTACVPEQGLSAQMQGNEEMMK